MKICIQSVFCLIFLKMLKSFYMHFGWVKLPTAVFHILDKKTFDWSVALSTEF